MNRISRIKLHICMLLAALFASGDAKGALLEFWTLESNSGSERYYLWRATGVNLTSPTGARFSTQTYYTNFADFVADVVGTWQMNNGFEMSTFEIGSFDSNYFAIPTVLSPETGDTVKSGSFIQLTYDQGNADSVGLFKSGTFDGVTVSSFDPLGFTVTLADGVDEDVLAIGVSGRRNYDLITFGPGSDAAIGTDIEFRGFSQAVRLTITAVPEPSSMLAFAGLTLIGVAIRRRRGCDKSKGSA